MMCNSCSKLSYKYTIKPCIKCHGNVLNTISVLCEFCSSTDKKCSVCLKKTEQVVKSKNIGGCKSCGSR